MAPARSRRGQGEHVVPAAAWFTTFTLAMLASLACPVSVMVPVVTLLKVTVQRRQRGSAERLRFTGGFAPQGGSG